MEEWIQAYSLSRVLLALTTTTMEADRKHTPRNGLVLSLRSDATMSHMAVLLGSPRGSPTRHA